MTEIRIRAFEQSDIAELHRIYSQPEVILNGFEPPRATLEERTQRMAVSRNRRLLIAEIEGRTAGFGELTMAVRRRAHVAQVRCVVDAAYAGEDVDGALLSALIDLGERWYGIKRFEAKLFTADTRQMELHRRFGFDIEATHQQFALRDGEYADACTMARLRD